MHLLGATTLIITATKPKTDPIFSNNVLASFSVLLVTAISSALSVSLVLFFRDIFIEIDYLSVS